jgi:hypothetical protein
MSRHVHKILLNGWEYTLVDGEWLYKAVPFSPKKKVVSEKPQIKLVESLEHDYKHEFDKMLAGIVKDVTKYLSV